MKDPKIPLAVNSKPEETVPEQRTSETSDGAPAVSITESAEPNSSSSGSQHPVEGQPSERVAASLEPPVIVESTIQAAENSIPAASQAPQTDLSTGSGRSENVASSSEASTEPTHDSSGSLLQASRDVGSPEADNSTSAESNDITSTVQNGVNTVIVVGDHQQQEETQQSQTSGDTPVQESSSLSTPANSANSTEGPAEERNDSPSNIEQTEPEVVLPVEHEYYFLQVFDIESQSLRTVGSFFSQAGEKIKAAVRKHLDWPATKDFQIWHRIEVTEVMDVSATSCFGSDSPDGSCYIVGDKLNSVQRSQFSEKGLFVNPTLLVNYLWAASRHHPSKAFTGTKTVEATFTSDFYSGEIVKGFYHGKGKHVSDSAATYTGDFVLGRRHGKGVIEYPTGDTYDGDWSENQYNGQGTFIEHKTGNKYVGGYKDGKRHGKGISYWEVADEEKDLCQICFGEEQDALFYDCGHVCACVACARMVDICPICRKNILNVVKIYRT